MVFRIIPSVLLLAACAPLPPSPGVSTTPRFEPLAERAVVYVVRTPLDSGEPQSLWLNEAATVTTLPGTYYRWDVAPGRHRIQGHGFGSESMTLTTEPGRIYFLEHTVIGDPHDGGVQLAALRQVGEVYGRALVSRSRALH